MPTYPEHMERNNVLMKRITEIKSEKGFLANKTEEETNLASSPTLKSVMSAALSKGGDQQFEESKTASSSLAADLLGFELETPSMTYTGSHPF